MPDPSPSHLTPEAIAAAVEAAMVALAPRLAQRVAAELSIRHRPIHQGDPSPRVLAVVLEGKYRGISKSTLLRRFRTIRAAELDPILESLSPAVVHQGRRYYGSAYIPPALIGEMFTPQTHPGGDAAPSAESTENPE